MNKITLVYKWCSTYDTFSFALKEDAERADRLNNVYNTEITWGELCNKINKDDFDKLQDIYRDMEELLDDDIVDWSRFDDWWGVYFPFWLFTEMEEIIPVEVLEKHSRKKDVQEDETYYEINARNLVPFICDLQRSGFEVMPTDELEFDP